MKGRKLRVSVPILLLLCGVFAVSMLGLTPTDVESSDFPSRTERLRGLAEVWGMVYYFHPALADLQKQEAWDSELIRAIPEVEAAETGVEFGMALQKLVSRLGDLCTQILLPKEEDYLRLPIDLKYVNGKTVVWAVGAEVDPLGASILGLKVSEVDGISVDEYLNEWLPYASGETLDLRRQWVYDRLLSRLPEAVIRLQLADGIGGIVELEMRTPTPAVSIAPKTTVESSMIDDDVLWVRIPSLWALVGSAGGYVTGVDLSDYYAGIRGVFTTKGIVIDFRSDGHVFGSPSVASMTLPEMFGRFTKVDGTRAVSLMQREHRGLAPDGGRYTPSVYSSGWRVRDGEMMGESLSNRIPLVFLVDSRSYPMVMPYVAPLQETGVAMILGSIGTTPMAETYLHPLPGGLKLVLRLSIPSETDPLSIVPIDSSPRFESGSDAGLSTALAALRAWDDRDEAVRVDPPGLGALLIDQRLSETTETTREGRLLGLFKLWNAVKYFYAYPDRIDGDWTTLLEEFIPAIEEAQTEADYAKELQRLLVHTQDGHAFMLGRPWHVYPIPPLDIQTIEGETVVVNQMPVLTGVGSVEMLPPGQVILEVNGVPVEEVLRVRLETTPGATQAHRDYCSHQWLLAEIGEDDIDLLIRNELSEQQLVRICRDCPYSGNAELIDPWWFDQGIAYVDLGRIEIDAYTVIVSDLWESAGILIDMRGYPRAGMITAMADLVFSKPTSYLQGRIPIHATPDPRVLESQTSWPQQPVETEAVFDGPIVLLTNVVATSAAETLSMLMQDSGRVVVVGETTSGTNGNVTEVSLPFGVSALFSGMEVRHVDGRPFQGIGIIPDVVVHPTLQGIREGRDEILEKGIEVLHELIARREGEG